MRNPIQDYMVSVQYYAPRGKERLMFLGEQISQRHLHYNDRLIGIVGDAGSGKSSLIKGMFPGMELTNDDDVLNPRKIMQVRDSFGEIRDATTFHLDIRFLQGFMQMYEISDFVRELLANKRRVIVEHFNLLYPSLGVNADIIVGIGEEIIVARPSIFGPLPDSIYKIVHRSLKYRKMAHTAEEITVLVLEHEFGITDKHYYFSDIRNGFVLRFSEPVALDFDLLEAKIQEKIALALPVAYYDDEHIMMGSTIINCNGPRFNVNNTDEIKHLHIIKEFIHDPKNDTYCLVGIIDEQTDSIKNRNTQYFLARPFPHENNSSR